MKRSAPALIFTLFLLTLIFAATLQYRLPSSLPADASPNFSPPDALGSASNGLPPPRPTGLEARTVIQEWLVDQAKSIGLQVSIQRAISLLEPYGGAGDVIKSWSCSPRVGILT